MTRERMQAEAIARARGGMSLANYATIVAGFMERGIAEAEIVPRENVLTFWAWKALGRSVKKGQHGVRVLTYIETEPREGEKNGHLMRNPLGSTGSPSIR